jgi:hypothetical protein
MNHFLPRHQKIPARREPRTGLKPMRLVNHDGTSSSPTSTDSTAS